MDSAQIIRELIKHTQQDFLSYFRDRSLLERAELIIIMALGGDNKLASMRSELDSMIPDTNDDSSWECSYALNTGTMILNLIDYQNSRDEKYYNDSVAVFFDTVDFKVQQDFERQGIIQPSENQIISHEIFIVEEEWFHKLVNESA